MKHNARIQRIMGPAKRIDSMEFHLLYITNSLQAAHFGNLLSKSWAVLQTLEKVEMKVGDCLFRALSLGFSRADLETARVSLHDELKAYPRAPEAADGLAELAGLAIMLRLIDADYARWVPKLFPHHTATRVAAAAVKKGEFRYGTLLCALSTGELAGAADVVGSGGSLSITRNNAAWMRDARLADVVAAACRLEQQPLEEAIEALVLEMEQLRADMGPSHEGKALRAAKRRLTKVRGRIAVLVAQWHIWAKLDYTTGEPFGSWEAEAKVATASILGRMEAEMGTARSFPWDDRSGEAAAEGRLPRGLVLSYLEAWNERLRSEEERDDFLPYELERSLRYFELYRAKLVQLLDALDVSIAELRRSLAASVLDPDPVAPAGAGASAAASPIEPALAVHAASARAANELRVLLFRRGYLMRRLRYVAVQQARGREATLNWYGKGKPVQLQSMAGAGTAMEEALAASVDLEDARAGRSDSETEVGGDDYDVDDGLAGRVGRTAAFSSLQAHDDSSSESDSEAAEHSAEHSDVDVESD